ncbi:MAG: alpha/beta hydrolase [Steroidobacteraceae bacterium]
MSDAAAYQPQRTARHEHIELRGRRFGLTRWGSESADPVLLLHGWLDCADAWQLLVDRMPEDWSFVALDWAGYGASEWNDHGYAAADYFADLEALLDRLWPQARPRVVAHSLGGTVASMYAGIRTERLRWLVSLEGFGLPRLTPEQVRGRVGDWLDAVRAAEPQGSYPGLGALAARIRQNNPCLDAAAAGFLAGIWSRPAPAGGWQLNADPQHRHPGPIRYSREEVEACWAHVTAPVLLLAGDQSEFLPRLGGAHQLWRWATLYPRASAHLISPAGHLLQYEQPQQVADHIVAFAAGVE